MSAKVLVICGLTFAAFVFLGICYGIHRRVRRAQREMARRRFLAALARTQDTVDEVENHILGIG